MRVSVVALLALLGAIAAADRVPAEAVPRQMNIDKNALEWRTVTVNPTSNTADCKYTCEQAGLMTPYQMAYATTNNTRGVYLCGVEFTQPTDSADKRLFPGSTVGRQCKAVVFEEEPPSWDRVVRRGTTNFKCGCFSVFRPSTTAPNFFGSCKARSALQADVCRYQIPTTRGGLEWRYGWTDSAALSTADNNQYTLACNFVGRDADGADQSQYVATGFEVLC